ncbi:G-protein alpha-subunit [Trichosporon asahii var. asahii CBS 2479]|uniref:G-protein alpha-subunit n=1 Tax=Trichosporon asahii var. asahii (strain ATCC 90039 / CBS 2479 / JCM 2466 / KCTC 7840 / NBRC 103889/ NCYC 2677 / UAMH 7654) TaxID=1186058 RepID=J4UGE7_TRIAS|nr:G-protein alpha-subunit [Trichosporon asahii var. asahii CBS 2479]EJT50515.1 G-protein alpha-subunit [Trichosporon asahii var. asahii CBS 2479]
MGGCMSSEATKVENRRTSDPKKPVAAAAAAPTTAPPAQAQTGAATTDASAAANGTTAAVAPAAAGPNGTNSATQGLSAALAQAPEAAGAGNKTGDKSNSIDRQLEDDSKKFKKECKLLLLGKSTIVKQMKIIHQNGYTQDELMQFKNIVHKNVLDSAQALVMAMRKIGVDPEDPTNWTHADRIVEYKADTENGPIPAEIFVAIEALWHDPMIPVVMDRSSEFYLMDSATYFFANIRRIAAPDYIPNEADVLRARTKTTGISETRFNMGQLSIHMFDVGGQRSFEAVTSIIFCVALSEYDQVLLEENGQNRMQESLVLFESVINSRWFLRTSVILFLNKIDVFKQKLPKVPLVNYFPEYTGGADINKAAKYILWRFTQTNRARLSVYPHLTQATDTSNIRLVFAAVKETILQNALRDSGIL